MDFAPDEYYGLKIVEAKLCTGIVDTDDKLTMLLSNGKIIHIWDKGQKSCELRYITCDDDVSNLIGHTLTRIEARDAGMTADDEHGEYEQMFIEVSTNAGSITLCTHNEHNGYYGGFALTITEDE